MDRSGLGSAEKMLRAPKSFSPSSASELSSLIACRTTSHEQGQNGPQTRSCQSASYIYRLGAVNEPVLLLCLSFILVRLMASAKLPADFLPANPAEPSSRDLQDRTQSCTEACLVSQHPEPNERQYR